MPKLFIQDSQGTREFETHESPISIGRLSSCTIQILEKKASKTHCTLEKEGELWKLIDNMSSNGTLVNGKEVNAKMLEPEDLIEIGSTKIRFTLNLSSSKNTANPTLKKKTERPLSLNSNTTPPPKKKTERPPILEESTLPSKRRLAAKITEGTPQAIERRQIEQIKWVTFIGVLLLIFVIIGNKLYQQQERQKKAGALAEKASLLLKDSSGNFLENRKKAQELYQEILDFYPKTPSAVTAKTQAEKLKNLIEKEELALREFNRIRGNAQNPLLQIPLSEQKQDYEDLLARHRGSFIESDISFELQSTKEALLEDAQRRYDQSIQLSKSYLINQEFGEALEHWKKLVETFQEDPQLKGIYGPQIQKQIQQIEDAAQRNFDELVTQMYANFEQENWAGAQTLLQRAQENFRGTPLQVEMKVLFTTFEMLQNNSKLDTGAAKVEARKRQDFYQLIQPAEELLKKKQFHLAYQQLLSFKDHPSLVDFNEERLRFLARLDDLQNLLNLLDKVKTKAKISFQSTAIFDSGAKVFDADDKGLSIEIYGGQARSVKRWVDLTSEQYYRLFLELNPSPEERLHIASFCFESDLLPEAHTQMVQALEKQKNLKEAIDSLFARKSKQNIPQGGFVIYDNTFMRPEEKERAIVSKNTKNLVKKLALQTTANARQSILDELQTLLNNAITQHGQAFVDSLKFDITLTLRKQRTQLLQQLANSPALKDTETLRSLKQELHTRRTKALELIMDEARYPYPYFSDANKQREVQDEVNKLVAAVREIWDKPFENAARINPAISNVTAMIKELESQVKIFEPSFDPLKEEGMNLDYIASLAGETLNIQNFSLDDKEREIITYNKRVLSENERVSTIATELERKQVQITNEYRHMMGCYCVRINDELVQAARWHSEYMSQSGQFAHEIPGHPHGAGPGERIRKAGYKAGGASENIAHGMSDPLSAHLCWLNSSGHHRNILTPHWRALGTGNSGTYWTQNFGSDLGSAKEKAEALNTPQNVLPPK
jgi:uncharacterized protein YkwD/pSer/pThr/pTyr-binding forkhead associated (FHA) protein